MNVMNFHIISIDQFKSLVLNMYFSSLYFTFLIGPCHKVTAMSGRNCDIFPQNELFFSKLFLAGQPFIYSCFQTSNPDDQYFSKLT